MASSVATRLAGSPDIFAAQWDSGMPGDLAAGAVPPLTLPLSPGSGWRTAQSYLAGMLFPHTLSFHMVELEAGTGALLSCPPIQPTHPPPTTTHSPLWCSLAGRRPAFGLNSLSSLGHMSLQALAEEAAAMLTRTAAVAGLGSPGLAAASAAAAMPTHTPTMAAAEAVPAATVLAKSLLLAMVMAQGVPIITQVRVRAPPGSQMPRSGPAGGRA